MFNNNANIIRSGSVFLSGMIILALGLTPAAAQAEPAGHPGGHPATASAPAAVSEQAALGQQAAGEYLQLADTEDRLQAAVEFLAGPDCAGRRPGTPGAEVALAYLEQVLTGLGVEPAPGARGMQQGFSVTRGIKVLGTPRVAVNGDDLGSDRFAVAGFSGSGQVSAAPVLFAGYGIAAPELEWNDYAGFDAAGAVVVALRGEPRETDPESVFSGTQPSVYSDIRRKAAMARDMGAVALVLVNNPLTSPEDQLPELRPTFSAANLDIPVVFMQRDVLVNALIGGTGLSWHEIVETMDLENAPQSAVLTAVSLDLDIKVEKELATGYNLVGVLPGSDPALAEEYVIVGAHYDHLGIGGPESVSPERYGEIHAGADDNASGVATVLAVADWAAEHPDQLGRSLLICLFSGEEMGLLGSAALMRNSPVPIERMHSMINLDMVGHLRDDSVITGGVESAEEFAMLLEAPAAAAGVKLNPDKSGLGGSDHMSFIRESVPSLFLCTGAFRGYHTPDDTVAGINFPGLGQVAVLTVGTTAALASWPGPLTFNAQANTTPSQGRNRGKLKVSMGTVPHYGGEQPVEGMGVGDVVPAGPAAVAGLLAGDVIIKIIDRKISSIHDFMFVMQDCEPGQVVPVTVIRDGVELVFEVTLAARNVTQ